MLAKCITVKLTAIFSSLPVTPETSIYCHVTLDRQPHPHMSLTNLATRRGRCVWNFLAAASPGFHVLSPAFTQPANQLTQLCAFLFNLPSFLADGATLTLEPVLCVIFFVVWNPWQQQRGLLQKFLSTVYQK